MRARPAKGAGIPQKSREIVAGRERGACARCGLAATDWHHRRSRRTRDAHTHCACVGIHLCRTCHDYVHRNPEYARALGFIVSAHEEEPWTAPVKTYQGWRLQTCDGDVTWLPEPPG